NPLSSLITVNPKHNLSPHLPIYKPKYNLPHYLCEHTNKNPIQDQDQKPISPLTLTLKHQNPNLLKTLTTHPHHKYKFTHLDNPNYKLLFTTPQRYTPTTLTSPTD
ncbi:SdrD B-like domain-containing protein, partial [Staphylococcus aureus]|uniref:SdrD B-like domain-containing protein n=1 Tax=Staphylococcus aureus TaxID=1280 RepID=UPI0011A12FE1